MKRYVLDQDMAAFRSLFDRYADRLNAWFLRSTGSVQLANDLVQTTFLHVHRARHDFRLDSPFKPWLFAIGANVRRDHYRKRARRPETPLDLERHAPSVAPDASTAEQRVVRSAVEQLPEHERDVVLLRWYGELSFPEIAETLGVTANAARVRAHRATKTLKRMLLGESDA